MQVFYRHYRSRRTMIAHYLRIFSIDRSPELYVRNVDRHLHNTVQTAARRMKDSLHISQRKLSLRFDVAGERLARHKVHRQLAGNIDDAVMFDAWRIMPLRLRLV